MPARFTDAKSREWDLSLDLGTLTTVREVCDVDLANIIDDQKKLVELMYGDVRKFGEVMFCILEDQCKEKDIDPKAFAKGFNGETMEAARQSLVVAVLNFSQPRRIAEQAAISLRDVMTAQIDLGVQRIKAMAASIASDSAMNSAA